MHRMWKVSTILLLLSWLAGCGNMTEEQQQPEYNALVFLQAEYRTTPIGIDEPKPRFSWQLPQQKETRGIKQTQYQIIVRNESGEVVWDSGKSATPRALHIPYQGTPLLPKTRYEWQVTVWDNLKQKYQAGSWFETGLMNPDISAWNGAQWIGGDADQLPLYSDYLPLFDISADIRIAKNSHSAALVFAANDPRLMDKNKNVYQLSNQTNESYFKIALDIAPLATGKPAKLDFYRAGYSPADNPEIPLYSVDIKDSVINQSNAHDFHTLLVHNEFGTVTAQIDGQANFWVGADSAPPNPIEFVFPPLIKGAQFTLNPLGHNHDYITYGMLAEFGFAVPKGNQASFKNLTIRNIHAPKNVLFSEPVTSDYSGMFASVKDTQFTVKDGAYSINAKTSDAFIVSHPDETGTPQLRSDFEVAEKSISKARLYVTARGIYEFYINGEKVSDDYYNPGLTQYNKTHLYQTYDVTASLNQGDNAMGAVLAEGWWSGLLGFGNVWNGFGDRQSLLAQLIVDYTDGTQDIFTTQPDNWTFSSLGPVRYGSLSMGEVYDARVTTTPEVWSSPEFTQPWDQAVAIPLEGTTSSAVQPNMRVPAITYDYSDMQLVGQIGEPAKVFKTIQAKEVTEVRPGVYVYDLGQNIVGVPKIHLTEAKAGDTITLRFSEMLYPNLPESKGNVGMIMTENYRAALSQDIYIAKDGDQTYQPRFTSHGFQYIEVTGIDHALPLEQVQGVAISSIQAVTAHFESSNAKVNQLWSNLVWSNVDNFLSVPTDCPQRNERMGWSGDINVFAPTATYISNSSQFLRRHLQAMRDTQEPNGRFADVAPVGGGFGGILWGVAGITVPWESYQQYGDIALLEEHYDAMFRYMDYLNTQINPETGLIEDAQLGDWLGLQNNQLGSAYLATAYYVYALGIMQDVADILNKTSDAEHFGQQMATQKAFFNQKFVSDTLDTIGMVGGPTMFNPMAPPAQEAVANTQTSFAVGLALNTFDAGIQSDMAARLANAVAAESVDDFGQPRPAYSLMTGFIGTAWISKALSENGYADEAYRLLLNEDYPSWLYPINQGATTIWERLNGYTIENGFGGNNSMNSFNHYSYGAVGEWLIAYAGGIKRDEPGFQSFVLAPEIDPKQAIEWVSASYDSPYGKITSSWKVEGNTLQYQAEVPPNTTATIVLPVTSESLKESQQLLTDVNGIESVSAGSKSMTLKVGSGIYSFTGELP